MKQIYYGGQWEEKLEVLNEQRNYLLKAALHGHSKSWPMNSTISLLSLLPMVLINLMLQLTPWLLIRQPT